MYKLVDNKLVRVKGSISKKLVELAYKAGEDLNDVTKGVVINIYDYNVEEVSCEWEDVDNDEPDEITVFRYLEITEDTDSDW